MHITAGVIKFGYIGTKFVDDIVTIISEQYDV